jgi:hypothetical protein
MMSVDTNNVANQGVKKPTPYIPLEKLIMKDWIQIPIMPVVRFLK